MKWYYAVNHERHGPVSEDEIRRLARNGVIRKDTLVWRTGMDNWRPFKEINLPPPLEPKPEPSRSSEPVSRMESALGGLRKISGTGGATPNSVLREQARAALSGHWLKSAGIVFVGGVLLMLCGLIPFLGIILIGGPLLLGLAGYALKVSRGEDSELDNLFGGFEWFVPAIILQLLNTIICFLVSIFSLMPLMMFLSLMMPSGGSGGELSDSEALMTALWFLLVFTLYGLILAWLQARIGLSYFYLADQPGIGPGGALRAAWLSTRGRTFKFFSLFVYFGFMCVALYLGLGAANLLLGMILGDVFGFITSLLSFPLMAVLFFLLLPYLMVTVARFYDDLQTG